MNKQNIKLVATDCDGVLTDGGLYYNEQGEALKKFSALDGIGFILLHRAKIATMVITAGSSNIIRARASKIAIDYVITETEKKLEAVNEVCLTLGIDIENVAYIGDDIYDIPLLESCGMSFVPASALEYIKCYGDIVLGRRGGEGCFREMVDIILGVNDISVKQFG